MTNEPWESTNKELTWRDLADLISEMTEAEKDKLVKISTNSGGLKSVKFFMNLEMRHPIPHIPYLH